MSIFLPAADSNVESNETNTSIILPGSDDSLSDSENIIVNKSNDLQINVNLDNAVGSRLSEMSDVDITNIEDSSLLIYDKILKKWIVSRNLNKHYIDSGQY